MTNVVHLNSYTDRHIDNPNSTTLYPIITFSKLLRTTILLLFQYDLGCKKLIQTEGLGVKRIDCRYPIVYDCNRYNEY